MESENLYSNKSANISYLSEINTVYLEFIGKIENDDYKASYNKLLEFIIAKNASAIITDQTKSQGGSMEARAWLVVNWLPEVKKELGDKKMLVAGISEAKFGFKKFISQYIEQTVKKMTPFPIEVFENLQDAISWIKKNS
jgi:RNA processing factor Prp31